MQQLIIVIETDGALWRGFAAIGGIVLCVISSSVVQQHAWFATSTKAVHTWIALTSLIYAKPALLTRGTLSQYSEGELINLVTVDCQAFLEVGQFIFFFAAMPWQAVIAASILFYLLGWVFVVGLLILAVRARAIPPFRVPPSHLPYKQFHTRRLTLSRERPTHPQ